MNFILEPVTFLLDIRVFIPLLCAYFLLFILCLFLRGKTLLLAKLISSSFFTVLLINWLIKDIKELQSYNED